MSAKLDRLKLVLDDPRELPCRGSLRILAAEAVQEVSQTEAKLERLRVAVRAHFESEAATAQGVLLHLGDATSNTFGASRQQLAEAKADTLKRLELARAFLSEAAE
jgi:hypothetical protein